MDKLQSRSGSQQSNHIVESVLVPGLVHQLVEEAAEAAWKDMGMAPATRSVEKFSLPATQRIKLALYIRREAFIVLPFTSANTLGFA